MSRLNRTRRMHGGGFFGDTFKNMTSGSDDLTGMTAELNSILEKLKGKLEHFEKEIEEKGAKLEEVKRHAKKALAAYNAIEAALDRLNAADEADANGDMGADMEDETEDQY